MASGVEAAGIVLGAIPLILAGLQFYAEGIGVTKRYWKYREEVNSLLVELRTENSIYINSISMFFLLFNILLNGVVQQKDIAIFLADPGGDRWKDQDFDTRLRIRLGTSYGSYLESINHLITITERYKERLKLNRSGKPQFSEKNAFKEHYKRLKFSLSKSDYKELMDRLRQANQSLYRLTVQTSHLAAHQASVKSSWETAPDFQGIKNRAESFHSALSNGWKCLCQADHSVSLLLEPRTDDTTRTEEEDDQSRHDPFHVLFRYDHSQSPGSAPAKPWVWEEADVRIKYEHQTVPPDSSSNKKSTREVKFTKQAIPQVVQAALKPHPNMQPIQDLCSAISTLQKPEREVCFSLLANEIAKQKYGVLIITPIKQLPANTELWSVSSLRAVLEDPKFAQQERLKLAITLASSVLQLHETPWLEETWGKDSIFFLNRTGKTQYDQPFVSHQIKQAILSSVPTVPSQMSCIIRNQTLYALGVALIELYYRKPIAELHQDMDGPQNTGNALFDLMTEFKTADRLAEALLSEAGAKYSDAVRRCIRCDFDQRASSLEDAKFQKAVYQGVVAQLQENYEYLFQD